MLLVVSDALLPKDIALNLYKSLVLAYLYYGDIIYQHTSMENLARLQMIQNNACRLITRDGKYASILVMHQDLELEFLVDRRLYHVYAFMLKFVKSLIVDRNIHDMFRSLEYQHDRNTGAQSRQDLIVAACGTRIGARAFSTYGAKTWNCLLMEVRESNTIETFGRKVWLSHT